MKVLARLARGKNSFQIGKKKPNGLEISEKENN